MAESQRIEQLLSALRDENEGLQNYAAAGLGQMGDSAIPRLIEMFEDDDLVIREAAVSAIVQIGESAIDPLIEALEEDEWTVREQAATALGKLKSSRAVPPLVNVLKDKDGGVRTARGLGLGTDWRPRSRAGPGGLLNGCDVAGRRRSRVEKNRGYQSHGCLDRRAERVQLDCPPPCRRSPWKNRRSQGVLSFG